MTADTNYYARSLLTHFDGVDGATTATDLSQYAHTMTFVGNAQLDTAQFKFGTASLLLDGTGDYVTIPNHAAFDFGSGDFTIECHVRLNSTATTGHILSKYGADTNAPFAFFRTGTQIGFYSSSTGATWDLVNNLTFGSSFTTGVQYHLAATRYGDTWCTFLDGTLVSTTTASGTVRSNSGVVVIGANNGGTTAWNGWIDELRITKGLAEYTASFTAPTAAYNDGVPPTPTATLELSLPMPTLSGYGGATAADSLPSLTIAGYGGGTLEGSLPALTIEANAGSYLNGELPALTIAATAHDATGDYSAELELPMLTMSSYGGANAALTLPSLALAITGSVTNLGTLSQSLPMLTMSGTGKVSGTGALSQSLPMFSLVGYSGAVCSVTLGAPTIEASGTTGTVGSMTATLPMFELEAEATAQNHGSAALELPALRMADTGKAWLVLPGFTLSAIGTATVTATYEAYAINLKHDTESHDEVTRYTNFPFTQVVRYKGSYFGVGTDGLYLLAGTTDYATTPTQIPWAFKTGMDSFKSATKKTIVSVYFRGRLGAAAEITLYPSEADGEIYSYHTPRDATPQNYRQKFGKGLRATHFAIGASGENELALDAMEPEVTQLSRRI